MKYFKGQKCKFRYPVVTMGTFDGVHIGHQALLRELKQRATEVGGESVVITYYHHPLETIHQKTFPYLLTEKDIKEELIRQMGIDCVLYLNFDEKMARMEPEKFLKEIIVGEVHARELVIGYDTHFGKFRKGDYHFLSENAAKYNYKVDIIEPLKVNNRIISSSLIRDLIREGNMLQVTEYLGREYSITGSVVVGHKIGREIGFPTINIYPADLNKLVPAIGVYLCEVFVDDEMYYGLTNIGYSPTLKTTGIKEIETHIIDFSADLYNKQVEVFFHKRLRDELKFDSMDALIKQIKSDVKEARKFFKI